MELDNIKTLIVQNGYNIEGRIIITMAKMVRILELYLNQIKETYEESDAED